MFDINAFMWENFYAHHVDFAEPGMERYPPQKFKRQYQVWRFSDMPSKIVTLNSKFELPTSSILHISDNWFHPESEWQDTPRVNENFFLENESFRKFIYHVKDFSLQEPLHLEDKFIYRQAGLPTKLMAFRSEQGSNFRYVNKMDELPTKKDALIAINHNPLFRVKVYGRLQFFRKFELILTSMLNTCCQLKWLNKMQFLYFPWGDEVYDKAMFIKSRTVLTPASLKRPESFHWLLHMHLLNYMWDAATTSLFKSVPDDVKPQVNIILQNNDKFLFYNLAYLQQLNPKNKAFFKFSNQLNLLSILGRVEEDNLPEEVKEKYEKTLSTIGIFKSTPNIDVSVSTPDEEVVKSTYDTETDDTPSPPDEHVEEVTHKLDKVIKTSASPVKVPTTKVTIEVPEAEPVTAVSNTTVPVIAKANVTSVQTTHDEVNEKKYAEEFLADLEADTDDFIDKHPDLTPGQRERYKKISKKWKEVTLNGVPLQKLISDSNNTSLDHEILNKEKVGPIPDEGALKSSLTAFDKDYMAKTYKKQLASVLVSFQKNGIFLTGLKEEKVITEMNNLTKYRAQYEDIRGNKTTIRFSIPTVGQDGRLKIDGVKHISKKQKLNLPIVKISDYVVSLASNQNKTRVERNINKAHNFLAYVESLINSPKTAISIEFGNSSVNLPISYEYASICTKYKKIEFHLQGNIKQEKYDLYFEYNTRAEHFGGSEEMLLALEKQYGTYFGKNRDNWFFINSQNKVHMLLQQGGENTQVAQLDSLISVLKLALLPGETFPKILTEWCSAKILDAYLPIIFLLGYRYGLRHMLDYMGVQYTITERRSKIIVGEGNLAAQESYDEMFGANINNVTTGTDGVIEDVDWIKIAGQEAANKLHLTTNSLRPQLFTAPIGATSKEKFIAKFSAGNVPFMLYYLGNQLLNKITFYAFRQKLGKKNLMYYLAELLWESRDIGPFIPKANIEKELIKYMRPKIKAPERLVTLDVLIKDLYDATGWNFTRFQAMAEMYGVYGTTLTPNVETAWENTIGQLVDEDVRNSRWFKFSQLHSAGKINYYVFNLVDTIEELGVDKVSLFSLKLLADSTMVHERVHAHQSVKLLEHDFMNPLEGIDYQYMDSEYEAFSKETEFVLSEFKKQGLGVPALESYEQVTTSGADTKSNVEIKDNPAAKMSRISLQIPNPPKLSTTLISGLDQIRELNIPNTELVVGASASMILYGIKKDTNRDLDCGISPEALAELESKGLIEMVEEESGWHKRLKGSVERGCEIDFGVWSGDGLIPLMPWDHFHSGTVVVDGIHFDNIYEMFRFYTWLLHHAKNDFFVEKRKRQLHDLAQAVSGWFNHQCYHGSALQGITTLQARETTSYKSRGPLVFATYFKHFAMTFGFKWNDDIFAHGWTIAEDGLTPIITMELKQPLQEADLRAPYSIYTCSDEGFHHLLKSEEDPDNFGGHPITEIIHSGDVDVINEEYRDDWWGDMLQLEELGLLHLKNKELVKKPVIKSLIQGAVKSVPDDAFSDISITLDTERTEDTPGLPVRQDKRFIPSDTSIPIKFADRVLWIDRYPLAHSLVFAGLDFFDTGNYEMSEFENKDVYFKLLQDKGMSINYLKGIDLFFDTFIDPLTYHTLKMMNEPTNMKDLLLRSVVLLTTLDHLPPSSSKNFRIRGHEQFIGILYNELARQYGVYSKNRGKSNVFSIPEEAVFLRILENSSLLPSEPGNPMRDFGENAYFTYMGFGGRTAVSFVLRDRKMSLDDTGVISEATPDNANVGINGHLTYDPGIVNTLGILDPKPIPELDPANCFTLHSLTFAYATSDDSKRICSK